MEQTQDGTGTMERAMTVTEFLEARIAEDEGRARDAFYDGQQWLPEEEAVVAADRDLEPILYLDRKRDAIHAAKWSPARVLAECAAKRAVIAEHELAARSNGIRTSVGCVLCNYNRDYGWEETGPCRTLRALAAVYSEHPDYQPEWA